MLGASSLLVLLAAVWSAQNVVGQDGLDLPSCAFDCALTAIVASGCAATSTDCLCGEDGFISSMASCVSSSCGSEDEQDTLAFAKEYCAESSAKPSAPAKKLLKPSSYQAVAAPVSYSPAARPTSMYPIPANSSAVHGAPTYKPASSLWANYSSSAAYKTASPSSSCTSSEYATGSAEPTPIGYPTSIYHHGSAPVRTSTVKTYITLKPSKAPVSQSPPNVYYTSTADAQMTTTLSTIVPKMPQGTGYSSTLIMNASWTAPLGPLQTAAAPSLARTQALGLLGFVLVAVVAVL